MTNPLEDDAKASALRVLIRATVIAVTAFGFVLTAGQIGAIQIVTEAVIQFARAWFTKRQAA